MAAGNNDINIPAYYYPKFDESVSKLIPAIWFVIYVCNALAILITNLTLIYVVCRSCGFSGFFPKIPKKKKTRSSDSRSKASSMHQYLIFLCVSQLLVGLVCLPLYAVFNFPQYFFSRKWDGLKIVENVTTIVNDSFSPKPIFSSKNDLFLGYTQNRTFLSDLTTNYQRVDNLTELLLSSFEDSQTNRTNITNLISTKALTNNPYVTLRGIPFETFCRAQTIFTFVNSFCGFGSGYAIVALAMDRYRIIRSKSTCKSDRIPEFLKFESAPDIITHCTSAFFVVVVKTGHFIKVMAKKMHRIVWLTILVLVTSLPITVITKVQRCMLDDDIKRQFSWNKIFLLYSTVFGIVIPVFVSTIYYVMSIRHLKSASNISHVILKSSSSVRTHQRAIRMIMTVLSLHIIVAIPLTLVNLCQSFGAISPTNSFWKRTFSTEFLNTLVSVDAWANVIIIFSYGGRFQNILKRSLGPIVCCKTKRFEVKETLSNNDRKGVSNDSKVVLDSSKSFTKLEFPRLNSVTQSDRSGSFEDSIITEV